MKFVSTAIAAVSTFIGVLWLVSLCIGGITSSVADPTWHGILVVALWIAFGALGLFIALLVGGAVGVFVDAAITDWQNERARQRRHKNKKV